MERRARGRGAAYDRRRNEIADAVLEVVADQGLAAVSQSTVAARAGVSPGRVQHYFPARHELIEAAFDRANALSSARIAARVGADAPPREALTVVLTELIPHDTATRTHMRIRQSFTALALSEESIAARMRRDYERFHGRLADLLHRDRETGALPAAVDPGREAVALAALAEGLAYYVLIGRESADAARDRVLSAIADLYT
ncbi:TetR/AcrR family transcriptional regulator [Nocardiopsis sp. CC223A]|uniref:TetR/AcrR family transcriptional regulator n=1 Tax=Nocardiopsis sp. CC223A TaxID=3044051 RepID=UPI00278BFEB8|nr:TetR family transcriptional regulator C-terminal domain-containing protein [Nocardiopsis sp. CC223A]